MSILQQWILVLLLAFTLRIFASPVKISNENSLSSTDKNPTEKIQQIANLSIAGIPNDFKLLPLMGPTRPFHMPNRAYYYSAIKALETLALEDWGGVMEKRTFETTKYPQVRIMVNTRHETIPRKYVIWALLLSSGLMDKVLGFGWIFFDLQWRDNEIGGLAFELIRNPRPPYSNLVSLSNTTEETAQKRAVSTYDRNVTYSTTLSDISSNQTGLIVPSNAGIVSATFMRHGPPMDEDDIYMMILMALSQAARHPNGNRITSFWHSDFDDYETEIYTNQQPQSRSRRPYYTFETFIKSLALYAEYFVTEGKLYKTGMMTMVDGVTVAISVLRYIRTGSDQAEVSTA